jgi:hypothetical protein
MIINTKVLIDHRRGLGPPSYKAGIDKLFEAREGSLVKMIWRLDWTESPGHQLKGGLSTEPRLSENDSKKRSCPNTPGSSMRTQATSSNNTEADRTPDTNLTRPDSIIETKGTSNTGTQSTEAAHVATSHDIRGKMIAVVISLLIPFIILVKTTNESRS